MHTKQFETPILLLIFNRPDCTRSVFNQIRTIQPKQLFIAADGPREGCNDEKKLCNEARSVVSAIDWDCQVKTLFSEKNWGCGKGPARGITWFFDHVQEGIILEDDCLPAPSFFYFCEELLQIYRNDNRVMEIGGVNLIEAMCVEDPYSYYYSEHNHTWGWATWRRAWKLYDYTIAKYEDPVIKSSLSQFFNSEFEYHFFLEIFHDTYHNNKGVTWWDYQWEFTRRINNGLSIVPKNNLIVNIGLGQHATHTLDANGVGAHLQLHDLHFPLSHPEFVLAHKTRDNTYFEKIFMPLRSRIKFVIKHAFRELSSKWPLSKHRKNSMIQT